MKTVKAKFAELRREKKKAFIAYLPFGFPSLKLTEKIIFALERAGVDLVELGIPFSDPLADGPIIQHASQVALKQKATTDKLFRMLKNLKGKVKIPLAVMTYYNPLLKFGRKRFFKNLKACGIFGLIVVDLPLEESRTYLKEARKYNLETISFITPTTDFTRAKKIIKLTKGFIYYISVTGITGPRSLRYQPLALHIRSLKKKTKLPICVGFGIHNNKQVKEISKFSDGVIVGSAIVKFIDYNHRKKDFLKKLENYVARLCTK